MTQNSNTPDGLTQGGNFYSKGSPLGASFIVGATSDTLVNVAVQLKYSRVVDDSDVTSSVFVNAYLSDDVGGLGITTLAPDTAFAIGTDGFVLGTTSTDKQVQIQTDALGKFDLDVNHLGGAHTWYLVVVTALGKIIVSDPILLT